MPPLYIQKLNKVLAEVQAAAPPPTPKRSLRDRFEAWNRRLPDFARDRPFSMMEFEAAVGTQGKYLSPVLLELGWTRKRIWATRTRYHRFWVPPRV